MSSKASEIASLNWAVDVEGHECLDSIPNLIPSGPARSRFHQHTPRQDDYALTVDPITIMVCCPKARPAELVTRTETTCAELPLLATREELVLEKLVPFTVAEHAA